MKTQPSGRPTPRKWGETRPGEMYPAVEAPGNPSWERRNPRPKLAPIVRPKVTVAPQNKVVDTRLKNGAILPPKIRKTLKGYYS